MDENGLPITGAGVNYTSVEAINQRELITYMNMFLLRTCSFLNNFSTKCESKLASLNERLETINTSITLLESKLDSVEELRCFRPEEATKDQVQKQAEQDEEIPNEPQLPTVIIETAADVASISSPPPPPPSPPPPPPLSPQKPLNPIRDDPRYNKYFKMLKMGVAEEAIRIKMRTEGVDPSLLDRSDDPAPPVELKNTTNDEDV